MTTELQMLVCSSLLLVAQSMSLLVGGVSVGGMPSIAKALLFA